MADHRIGKIFVELDLDASRYMKSQQIIRKEAQHGAKILEKNFKNLGLKSGATYDLMRAQAVKSFEAIKKSSRSTSHDRVRAEKAMAEKIRRINDQQYGHTTSMVQRLKKHWLAMSAVVVASLYAVNRAIRASLNAYAIFDKGLIGIQKTTNMTDQQMIAMGASIKKMASEIPVSTEGLLEIAQAAGQLGVTGVRNVSLFTETMAKMQITSDVVGAQGAKSLARLLVTAHESTDQIKILGSVIVSLGNQMETSESEIIEMASEIGRGTTAFNVSSASVAAYAAALKAMGAKAEGAGTAITKSMIMIEKAILKGGERFLYLQQVTGMTGETIERVFEEDSAKVFNAFIQGIHGMTEEGESAITILEKFGLTGIRTIKNLTPLIKNIEQLDEAFRIANKEVKNATALDLEAMRASQSFSAQMQMTKNVVDEIAAGIGKGLAPAIVEVTQDFRNWVEQNERFINQDMPKKIGAITDKVKGLIDICSKIPGEVVGVGAIGLVGRLFFGSKIGLVMAALATAIALGNKLSDMMRPVKDLKDAYIELHTAQGSIWVHRDDMDAYQASLNKIDDATKELGDSSKESFAAMQLAANEANKEFDKYWKTLQKHKAAMDPIILAAFPEYERGIESIIRKYDRWNLAIEKNAEKAGYSAEEIARLYEDLALRMGEDFGKLFDVDLDFKGQSFGNELADGINNAMISMKSLNDLFEKHAKIQEDINSIRDEGLKKQAQAALDAKRDDYFRAQISGYRQLFGTISQLFKENSKEREIMHKAEMAFAAMELVMSAKKMAMDAAATVMAIANSAKRCVAWGVEAVAAAVAGIAGQATGDPYTAFARIAAMIALMGAVLAMAGKAFGGGGGSSGAYSGGVHAATTGTVLGAPTESSESLQHSLDLMEEYHAEDYKELVGIHNELIELNQNITGLISNIVRGFGTFEGGKFEFSEAGRMEQRMDKGFAFIGKQMKQFFTYDFANTFLDKFGAYLSYGSTKWLSKVMGKIFGKEVKIRVTGAGIALGEGTIGGIRGGEYPSVQAYYDIYKKTKKGWARGGGTDRKRWTEFEAVESDIERLFSKIYGNISNTLVYLAEGFNIGAEKMAEVFAYEFAAVKLDLKGLTGEEISEKINAWISTLGDTAVEALFADVVGKYQEVDEGMLETAMRLVVQKEILFSALKMTNQAFDDTSVSAIDFSQALIAVAGDFEDLISAISNYYDKFFTEHEKHQDLLAGLSHTLADLDLTLPSTRAGFRDLVESLDLTTDVGKEAFVALMKAADAADAFYDYIENISEVFAGAISYAGTSQGWQAMAPRSMSSTEQYIAQYRHVQNLHSAYDGTTASAIELSDALGILSGLSYSLAAEIQNAINSISQAYQSVIEAMTLETMTGQQKYNYYTGLVTELYASLSSLTDPAAIQRVMDDILRYTQAAWGLMDEAQKKRYVDQYTSFLSKVEMEGIERLEEIGNALDDANKKLIDELGPMLKEAVADIQEAATLQIVAADTQVEAANTQVEAASTPVTVDVNIDSGEVG